MKIVCDACQAKYSIADEKIQGKAFKIRCKKCNHIIVVKPSGEVAASAGADKLRAAAPAAAAPAAAAAVEPGVWHVVVNGEQVGPITEAEVREKLHQNQINAETLVWKEGFADWTALSSVPELAALQSKPARASASRAAVAEPSRPAAKSLFPTTSPSPDGDVFGAPTVVTPAGTADLFAAAAPAAQAVPSSVGPSPSSPFLFGGAPAQPSEPVITIKNPGNGAGGAHLTGQRNENSVLFSLSNLEALAVPSQSGSGGIRPPSSTSNTEGSGLIDIRSMAAMTLNDGSAPEGRRSSEGLPSFSTPQFSPVAPVLLPISNSGPPKWVYPVLVARRRHLDPRLRGLSGDGGAAARNPDHHPADLAATATRAGCGAPAGSSDRRTRAGSGQAVACRTEGRSHRGEGRGEVLGEVEGFQGGPPQGRVQQERVQQR